MLSPYRWSDTLGDLLHDLRFCRHDSPEFANAQQRLATMASQADAFALVIHDNVVMPRRLSPNEE